MLYALVNILATAEVSNSLLSSGGDSMAPDTNVQYTDASHEEAARMAAQMIVEGKEVKFFVDPSLLHDALADLVGEERANEMMHQLYDSTKVS